MSPYRDAVPPVCPSIEIPHESLVRSAPGHHPCEHRPMPGELQGTLRKDGFLPWTRRTGSGDGPTPRDQSLARGMGSRNNRLGRIVSLGEGLTPRPDRMGEGCPEPEKLGRGVPGRGVPRRGGCLGNGLSGFEPPGRGVPQLR